MTAFTLSSGQTQSGLSARQQIRSFVSLCVSLDKALAPTRRWNYHGCRNRHRRSVSSDFVLPLHAPLVTSTYDFHLPMILSALRQLTANLAYPDVLGQ
jgi:hypothetical protein